MKKFIAAVTVVLTAGISFAAVGAGRTSPTVLSRGTVLDPFKLQVVSANQLTQNAGRSTNRLDETPTRPIDDSEVSPIPVRPGPFTPPPRSPYAPPPR